MATPRRGEVWIVDLGMVAKTRPCLTMNIALDPNDRVLAAIVPVTSSIRGTLHEISVAAPFIRKGVFDVQQMHSVPQAKFIRRLRMLPPDQLALVEAGVRNWLGL